MAPFTRAICALLASLPGGTWKNPFCVPGVETQPGKLAQTSPPSSVEEPAQSSPPGTIGRYHDEDEDENHLILPGIVETCAGNTPTTRHKWCKHSIDTDYTRSSPTTGVVREYWLEATDVILAPDGVSRALTVINGTVPGPTLYADWGDIVRVHFTNSLHTSHNGSSIHFHGIKQNHTVMSDGVPSITECPLAPGKTRTYEWKAEQYGSSWYHSHFELQAWQGIFGGLIINGPATADYDEDLGSIFLNDWGHEGPVPMDDKATIFRGPPIMDSGLINGTNTFGNLGRRYNIAFEAGKSYRLRFINAAIDSHFKFMLDNHEMTVIASDFIPLEPYVTKIVDIAIGQRYDVIIKANQQQVADNFWLRAIPQLPCSLNKNAHNIRAIVHYGKQPSEPTTTGYPFLDKCQDEKELTPWFARDAREPNMTIPIVASLKIVGDRVKWSVNGTIFTSDWSNPTLLQVIDQVPSFKPSTLVVEVPDAEQAFYMVLYNLTPFPHPIHLHGHDFAIISQGPGLLFAEEAINAFTRTNPPRRDTATLPALGHLVLAIRTTNPGAWLMHCHIGWHTSEGFGLQILERAKDIPALLDTERLRRECQDWKEYQSRFSIEQSDSGI
ncbi:hypothetical protein CDD80_2520 [Ophiocordyceps camponoti-rufipedis]|uniref:Laccase n=1 Tax=Ophiocordyceps camponoti-rufipedis TaxID=2004952 RepID=A0A2C5Z7T9_9HYPO|nr:hypothetical protein CDD80_2520 [Ophiocordyceps camponoti-rufipedis]